MKNFKYILTGIILGALLMFSGNAFADRFVRHCYAGHCQIVRVVDRPYYHWRRPYWHRWHWQRWHHWHHW